MKVGMMESDVCCPIFQSLLVLATCLACWEFFLATCGCCSSPKMLPCNPIFPFSDKYPQLSVGFAYKYITECSLKHSYLLSYISVHFSNDSK